MKKNKKLIAGMLSTGLIVGGMNLTTFADELDFTKKEILNIPGVVNMITMFDDIENIDVSYIETGNKSYLMYGIAGFGEKNIVNFIEWLVKEDDRYADIFDLEEVKKIVGTDKFNELWKKAGELDEYDFALKQQTYAKNNYVNKGISKVKRVSGIDIESSRALEELAFSTAVDFGLSKLCYIEYALDGYDDISEVDVNKVIDTVIDIKKEDTKNFKVEQSIIDARLNSLEKERQYLKEINAYEEGVKIKNQIKDFFSNLKSKLFGN